MIISMRVALSFLVLFLLLVVFLLIASGEEEGSDVGLFPPVSGEPSRVISAPGLSTPAPGSGREGTETTLVEVATGRTLRLWEQGANIQNPRFSGDGRWLVYNEGATAGSASVYRIDLSVRELKPEPLTSGFNPTPSNDGDIAFVREVDGQRASVHVRSQNGTEHRLSAIGSTYAAPVWSPDGRWLAYSEGYKGDGERMATVVVDTRTWEERVIGYRLPCQCDSPPLLDWSESGQHLLFEAAGQGSVVVAAGEWQPRQVPAGHGRPRWASEGVIFAMTKEGQTDLLGFVRFDVRTGRTSQIISQVVGFIGSDSVSRDGTKMGYETRGARSEDFVSILNRDGRVVWDQLPGAQPRWSADGDYLSTWTRGDQGCAGLSVYKTDSANWTCLEGVALRLSASAAWSQSQATLAYLRSSPQLTRLGPTSSNLYIFDAETGKETLVLEDVRGPIQCVRWSPDGRWLIVDDYCDTI